MEGNGWLDPRNLESYIAPSGASDRRVNGDDDVGPRQRVFELDAFTVAERMRSRVKDLSDEDPDLGWRMTQVMRWQPYPVRNSHATFPGEYTC
jgi:hypothetical protein